MFDLLGQDVYAEQLPVNNNMLNATVSTELSGGVYILKLEKDTYRFSIGK